MQMCLNISSQVEMEVKDLFQFQIMINWFMKYPFSTWTNIKYFRRVTGFKPMKLVFWPINTEEPAQEYRTLCTVHTKCLCVLQENTMERFFFFLLPTEYYSGICIQSHYFSMVRFFTSISRWLQDLSLCCNVFLEWTPLPFLPVRTNRLGFLV